MLLLFLGQSQITGRFEYIISEKGPVTGLEVTLQSSSRIFQVTGLTFSSHKYTFIVCIHARTPESFNRVLLIPWMHSFK